MIKQRIMYVCSECAEGCPEACGHYDRTELRVMPDGAWLCESCFDNNDDNEFLSWGHLPAPEEYRRIPDSAQGAMQDDDPTANEQWNAGCDFALAHLCKFLGVDFKAVSWDAATETVDGDVLAVIGNILRVKFGEDWGPNDAPALTEGSR